MELTYLNVWYSIQTAKTCIFYPVFSINFAHIPRVTQTLALPEWHTIYSNTACGSESSTHKGEITATAI